MCFYLWTSSFPLLPVFVPTSSNYSFNYLAYYRATSIVEEVGNFLTDSNLNKAECNAATRNIVF